MTDKRQLKDLAGVGPAFLADFELLGVRSVTDLARQDGNELYQRLCDLTGARQDPCVLDVFRCAVAQACDPDLPKEQRNWWYWSRLRKKIVEEMMRSRVWPSSISKGILIVTLVTSIVTCSCKAPPTWSAEARSPDGKRITTANGFDNGGFLAPGPSATFVYLNRTVGSQPKVLIFALSGGESVGSGAVGMNWLAPNRLELTYKGHPSIDFQAIHCAGVDISVRELPSGEAKSKPLPTYSLRVGNPELIGREPVKRSGVSNTMIR